MEYLPGGVDSGFQRVEREVYPERLLHLKGTKNVRVKQVRLCIRCMRDGWCNSLGQLLCL